LKYQSLLVALLSSMLATVVAVAQPKESATRAQEAPAGFWAELLKGVPVDSPRTMLYWGSGTHDSLTADPRMASELRDHRRGVWNLSGQSQLLVQSERFFGIPVDSAYLHYFWPPDKNAGLRMVWIMVKPAYVEQVKDLFFRNLGKPEKSRSNKRGRFLYEWHYRGELSVWLANRRPVSRRGEGTMLLITHPRLDLGF
jgi:hypothetical protein